MTFAIAVAAAIGLAAPAFGLSRGRRLRTFAIAVVVLVSHGLLDTLTDGGLGCALLWPFDLTRYCAPWRPIPVAPIGLDFLSLTGLAVSLTELVLFAPVVMFGLRLNRLNRYVLPVWLVAAWLMTSGDPAREAAIGFVLREDTEYAGAFSDRSFRSVDLGDADTGVQQLMGPPLTEWWGYRSGGPDGCPVVYFASGLVTAERQATGTERERVEAARRGAGGPADPIMEACSRRGVHPGMPRVDVQRALGAPDEVCWAYTRSPGRRHYRVRVVCFSEGKVVEVFRQWQ